MRPRRPAAGNNIKISKMAKEPNIFVKMQAAKDALDPKVGGANTFRSSIGDLIDAGNVLAIGEDSIEKVFDTSDDFKKWFDGLAKAVAPTSSK